MKRMHRVYSTLVPFQAHMVRAMLVDQGVAAEVRNDNLAPYCVWAEVWVSEDQWPKASMLVAEITRPSSCVDDDTTTVSGPDGGEGSP
ncbi:MAG: DUF2007 domain-containing protein [Myxococcota bacterium]